MTNGRGSVEDRSDRLICFTSNGDDRCISTHYDRGGYIPPIGGKCKDIRHNLIMVGHSQSNKNMIASRDYIMATYILWSLDLAGEDRQTVNLQRIGFATGS